MSAQQLILRLRSLLDAPLPLPGAGNTAERHRRLTEIGREDLSLARLAEAHWDAVAILAEDHREPVKDAIYGVWASEIPGCPLEFNPTSRTMSGRKMFCSGAELIDRALVTVGSPDPLLVEVDLRGLAEHLRYDHSVWKATAFSDTHTSTVCFDRMPVAVTSIVGDKGWYLDRPGFWHGACGPACCWAGGAIGLVDYARLQSRSDAHTLAHLGAMHAAAWSLQACLKAAGEEIDAAPRDSRNGQIRALTVRHLVEQTSTEILRRLPRAYGPRPIALDEQIARRYQELDVYLRQSHAERDLESLGRMVR